MENMSSELTAVGVLLSMGGVIMLVRFGLCRSECYTRNESIPDNVS